VKLKVFHPTTGIRDFSDAPKGEPYVLKDDDEVLLTTELSATAPMRRSTADFLKAIHPGDAGFMELRAFKHKDPGKPAPCLFVPLPITDAGLTRVTAYADRWMSAGCNIYHGVANRRADTGGKLTDCANLWALYIEIDLKHGVPLSDIWTALKNFPLRPTFVVHSGGGLHVYWMLSEPIDLTTPLGIDLADQWLHTLAQRLHGEPESTEPARVLRVPDTLNLKEATARPVVLLTQERHVRYTLADVITVLGDVTPRRPPNACLSSSKPGDDTVSPKTRMKLARAWLTKQPPAVEGHGGDKHTFHICAAVGMGHNLTEDEAFDVLTDWNTHCVPPWDEPDLRRLIRNGAAYGGGQVGDKLGHAGRVVSFQKASEVMPEVVKWLWDHRIPFGTFGLLGGREGIGKSLTTIEIAAQLTRGTLPGSNFGIPCNVIISAAEDSWAHVIVPRLIAAGADLERIERVEVESAEGSLELSFPKDLDGLKVAVNGRTTDQKVRLLILDPLLSQIAGKLDTHKDSDVRKALHPLVKFADDTGVAVVGIIHVNKSQGSEPMDTLMGSRAFTAVSRFVLFAIEDPHNPGKFLLGHPKSNLGQQQKTLTYEIVETSATATIKAPVIKWTGSDPRRIREILQEANGETKVSIAAMTPAAVWLDTFLDGYPNGVESKLVKTEGAKLGFSSDVLKRAVTALCVCVAIAPTFPKTTLWSKTPF
jgi:hypothetical protein